MIQTFKSKARRGILFVNLLCEVLHLHDGRVLTPQKNTQNVKVGDKWGDRSPTSQENDEEEVEIIYKIVWYTGIAFHIKAASSNNQHCC